MKIVLITGSREWDDERTMKEALRAERPENDERMMLVHGGAHGADLMAHDLGTRAPNCLVARIDADWDNEGNFAGPNRNKAMLDFAKPDVVLAFFKEGAKNIGTGHMVRIATDAGYTVKQFRG